MSEPLIAQALLNAASAYYRPAGRFAWHFARGKLRGDPAFRAILEHGLLRGRTQLLDLGAGQGLLAAWLLAARRCAADERAPWPRTWPQPPALDSYTGIEINPREVRRARRAFALDPGANVQLLHGDIVDADYGAPDAVVILDVLHFVDYAAQDRILDRVRAALGDRGLVLLRVGDADGGLGFRLSKAVDRTVALARRARWLKLQCRPLREWRAVLEGLGFETRTLPMSAGTPFTNTLIVGQLR